MNSEELERWRKGYMKMVIGIKPNFMITLTHGYMVTSANASTLVPRFFNSLQREYYGRDWAKQRDREWPTAFAFFEHADSNPHYHALAHLPKRFGWWAQTHGDPVWKAIAKRGQIDVAELDHPRKAIRYCTKELWKRERFDDIVIYKDTRIPKE